MTRQGEKVYLSAIKALRTFINESCYDGGWLPPGREMAKRLGISHPTYCKALRFIEGEGMAVSYPKKGHYVTPHYLWCRKIGLVIGEGRESPFVRHDFGISDAIDHISNNEYYCHIIQGATYEHVHENALIHDVKGMIWFHPSQKAIPEIEVIRRDNVIPLVIVHAPKCRISPDICVVDYDACGLDCAKTKYVISKGHRRIAYIGPYEQLVKNGSLDLLTKHGVRVDRDLCVPDITNSPDVLTRLVLKKKVTGVLCEGEGLKLDYLLKEASRLDAAVQPEIVVSRSNQAKSLEKRYPDARLTVIDSGRGSTLGKEAARILVNHLQKGIPLENYKLGPANDEGEKSCE